MINLLNKKYTNYTYNENNKKIITIIVFFVIIITNFAFISQATIYKKNKEFDYNNSYFNLRDKDIKEWCFLSYLNGDYEQRDENNVIIYINQLELIGSNSDIDIVVQADDRDIWNGETRRYYITYDNTDSINSQEVDFSNKSEKNMGDSNTLCSFLNWAINKYPAKRYCVLTYGHAKGWLGHNILPDISNISSTMNLTQFRDSLSDASRLIKEKSNQIKEKIDILIMIPCFMGMIECCYQIKDSVEYYIASEGAMLSNFVSLNNIADILTKYPSDSLKDISQRIVNGAHNNQNQHRLFGMNLSEIDSTISAVNDLAAIGRTHISNGNITRVKEAFSESVVYNHKNNPHPHDLIEIAQSYDCCKCIDIQNRINNILIKPDKGITNYGWNGLSIYFPPNKEKENMDEYKKLDFAKNTHWDEFLEEYLDSDEESANYRYILSFISLAKHKFPLFYDTINKIFPVLNI